MECVAYRLLSLSEMATLGLSLLINQLFPIKTHTHTHMHPMMPALALNNLSESMSSGEVGSVFCFFVCLFFNILEILRSLVCFYPM